MSEETKKILEMLAAGKVSVDEAERLLSALGEAGSAGGGGGAATTAAGAKFLRVEVAGDKNERIDIRVPLALVRAGMKFSALIPEQARGQITTKLGERGINLDLNKLSPGALDDLVTALCDLSVDVAGEDGEKVRVYCE